PGVPGRPAHAGWKDARLSARIWIAVERTSLPCAPGIFRGSVGGAVREDALVSLGQDLRLRGRSGGSAFQSRSAGGYGAAGRACREPFGGVPALVPIPVLPVIPWVYTCPTNLSSVNAGATSL